MISNFTTISSIFQNFCQVDSSPWFHLIFCFYTACNLQRAELGLSKHTKEEKHSACYGVFNSVFSTAEWKKAVNLSNRMDRAKNTRQRLSHVLRGLQKPTEANLSSKSLREFVLLSSWAYFESVIDWSWVNPIMHFVAQPCGQTAVYIRALISIPGEPLQI